jgi:hypothetical protein
MFVLFLTKSCSSLGKSTLEEPGIVVAVGPYILDVVLFVGHVCVENAVTRGC